VLGVPGRVVAVDRSDLGWSQGRSSSPHRPNVILDVHAGGRSRGLGRSARRGSRSPRSTRSRPARRSVPRGARRRSRRLHSAGGRAARGQAAEMKFVHEYRDPQAARALIRARTPAREPPRTGHGDLRGPDPHADFPTGIDQVLAGAVELIHGPGCPVCVTPSRRSTGPSRSRPAPGVVLATYGDMMRVPGSVGTYRGQGPRRRRPHRVLPYGRAEAGRVAPLVARSCSSRSGSRPPRRANAMAVHEAEAPRRAQLLGADVARQGAAGRARDHGRSRNARRGVHRPGHVCTIMGSGEYEDLANAYRVPFVIAGFEPLDLLDGLAPSSISSRTVARRPSTDTGDRCAARGIGGHARCSTPARNL